MDCAYIIQFASNWRRRHSFDVEQGMVVSTSSKSERFHMRIRIVIVLFASMAASTAAVRGQASFKVGGIGGAALLADGRTFVVSIPLEGTLVYYDTVDDKELRKVELEFQPAALAIQGDTLFAAAKGAAVVHMLDPMTGAERGVVKLAGEPVRSLACHPEKGLVYATNTNNAVVAIDPKTKTSFATQAKGQMIVVDPSDAKFVYTGIQGAIKEMLVVRSAPRGNATVSVAKTGDRASLLKYSVHGRDLRLVKDNDNGAVNGRALAVSPDGKRVAMAGGGGWLSKTDAKRQYVIAVYDTDDLQTVVGQIDVGAYPAGIAFHPKENLGLAYRGGPAGEVLLFSSKSLARKGAFSFGKNGSSESVFLAFSGDGKKVICANYGGGVSKDNSEISFYPVELATKPKSSEPEEAAKPDTATPKPVRKRTMTKRP